MNSPTREISHGLKALNLDYFGEKGPSLPSDETCSSLSHSLHLSQHLDHQGPTEPRHREHYCEPLSPNVRVDPERAYPLVFAQLENTDEPAHNGRGTCGCDVDNVRQTVSQLNHEHVCPSCRMIRDDVDNETSGLGEEALEQEIVDSFNVLCVSSPTCVAIPQQNVPSSDATMIVPPNPYLNNALLCRTCRQEVCAPSLLDDTTVDDLAGYLDQIVFLPKPMSEMAELMYT